MLDIVDTTKTGPGSKLLDVVLYLGLNFNKYLKFYKIVLCIFEKTL